jgi:hypothetical protein
MKGLSFLIALFLSSLINAEITHFERGVGLYEQRGKDAVGLRANNDYIDQSIHQFLKAMKVPESELDAGVYLLKCYYYKGKFIAENDDEKKENFNEGKFLGERLIDRYPGSAAAHYWYLVNLGSWSEIYGILSAAKEGVANTMRKLSNKIIDIDKNYSDGGGYFMLGAVHFKSPYIPFLLSWPSDEEALKYLSLAYDTGASTPNQTVYLSRVLYKNGQKQKAISLLSSLVEQEISETNKLEDIEQHNIAKEQLKEWE